MYLVEHNDALRPTEYIYIVFLLMHFKQNGMSSIKINVAIQACFVNPCKNLRSKILKYCANIDCNRQCLNSYPANVENRVSS
jgi:hypothetical protein